jgi:transcriptional regulator with XRE-family HTH domain
VSATSRNRCDRAWIRCGSIGDDAVVPHPSRTSQHRALGRAVRELRACHGVSQEELGYRSGLHRNYVGAIERGELNPTLGVLLRLAAGLGVPLSELVALGERRVAGDLRHATPLRAPACGARRRPGPLRLLPLWDGRVSRAAARAS